MKDFPKLARLLEEPLYESTAASKAPLFLDAMREVTQAHIDGCAPYARLCEKRGFSTEEVKDAAEIPYLPTSFFKNNLLLSVAEDEVFREIRSSATTSGQSSRMGLDRATNKRQSKCFNKTILNRVGNTRFDFVVLDVPNSVERSEIVTARSSTIRSLMFCSKSAEPCLKEEDGELVVEREKIESLLRDRSETASDLIIFGFTFALYAYVVRPLLEAGVTFDLPGAKVLHIGGWKKLESEKVTSEKLVEDCCRCFGVQREDVVDLYGFTEQGGLIYPTCEAGRRHVPIWGEVIARDATTLEPLPVGESGLMQFMTPIQTSYPGHSVLTEDVGMITGRDDCPCGRNGTTFVVTGRALNAEVRGCGDIMAEKFA